MFQAQQAIFGDETSSHYLQKKKGMGQRETLQAILCLQLIAPWGRFHQMEREVSTSQNTKHLYNCPSFITSLRLSSSSDHNPFGSAQVPASADSRAWPQAQSGRRVLGILPCPARSLAPPLEARGNLHVPPESFTADFVSHMFQKLIWLTEKAFQDNNFRKIKSNYTKMHFLGDHGL